MKKIGLISVDGTHFPNLALMKISAYHKQLGDSVEWYNHIGDRYDLVYASKVFAFTPDFGYYINADQIEKGGTGYSLSKSLPSNIDTIQPDYTIYPNIDRSTAYGFLTRGCPNKCKWCIVPIKEGKIKPYMDVTEIAIDGRNNLILMDNNILASDYGLAQIEKIIKLRLRVDFNQAMDARLVTEDIARLLAQVKWINVIRFGCDTPQQIEECERSMILINKYCKSPKSYLLYTMINNDLLESYYRLSYFRSYPRVRIAAQPFRDFYNPRQIIPQWQTDMARWAMRREFWVSCDFREFEPRKGFKCKEYFY